MVSLLDYDIASQQLSLKVYFPQYDVIQYFEDLKTEIEWIVLLIVGEIAYRCHIQEIQLDQLPLGSHSFLPLVELVDLIDYLRILNSRKKKRVDQKNKHSQPLFFHLPFLNSHRVGKDNYSYLPRVL